MQGRLRKYGPRLTVSLTSDDHNLLNRLADRDDVSVSWLIRRAIKQYLSAREKEVGNRPPRKRASRRSSLQEIDEFGGSRRA